MGRRHADIAEFANKHEDYTGLTHNLKTMEYTPSE